MSRGTRLVEEDLPHVQRYAHCGPHARHSHLGQLGGGLCVSQDGVRVVLVGFAQRRWAARASSPALA